MKSIMQFAQPAGDQSAKSAPIKMFQAIHVAEGSIRPLSFEAVDLEDARKFAATLGFGLIGEAPVVANQSNIVAFERPDAFDVPQARHKLGGISRSTLYRLLKRGKLSRLTDTRKVLITRRSIERYLACAA